MGLYKKKQPHQISGTVTSCQTPHRNLYLKVSTNCFQKKSLLHHSDSWGIREWSQSDFWKQWSHIKHPVKKIHRKVSTKCFHKVYVFGNLVIPWEVEAIRFLSKALHKSFHNKVYFQAPFLQGSKIKITLQRKKYLNTTVPLLGLKVPFLFTRYSYIIKFVLSINNTITVFFKIS